MAKKSHDKYITLAIDPNKLVLLERNARYMKHETMQALIKNIARDGDLEQDPFCAYHGYFTAKDKIKYDDDGVPILEVLSGNHRVLAAREAGIKEIQVKVYALPLTRAERIAKQLAHNAIVGEDDPAILKELYSELDDLALREYAGLDDKTLALLDKVTAQSLSEANLDYQMVTVAFLPDEYDAALKCLNEIKQNVGKNELWLARSREIDPFFDSLATASGASGTKNVATGIMILLSIFRRHLEDLAEYWCDSKYETPNRFVPLASIINTDSIPAQSGIVIKKAVEKMRDEGIVSTKNLWQVFEYLAADYLAGS